MMKKILFALAVLGAGLVNYWFDCHVIHHCIIW